VPILAEYRRQRGVDETRALVGRVGTLLAVALLGLSVIGVLAAPWLVYALASGFARTPGKVELTAEMIRIVFPYILFISLVSLAGGVLNVYRLFAIPAFTPVLLNLSIIGAALFLAPYCDPPIVALAWGVLFGGVAQLALQLTPLPDRDAATAAFDWRDEGVRRVLAAMGPVLGVSRRRYRRSSTRSWRALGDGRISWITYADRLMEFPAHCSALPGHRAPHRSRSRMPTRIRSATRRCWTGACGSRSCALPAAVALILAIPMISTLYQYGRFTVDDVYQTRVALLGYSVGLLGLILVKILAPGFYARQIMKTPVKIALLTVLVSQTLAVILMFPLGHAGLTLSTSIGACLNAALLFWFLRRNGIYRPHAGWLLFVSKVIVALFVLAAVLLWLGGPASFWLSASLWAKVSRLAGVCAAGAAAYFAALWLLGFRFADFNRRDANAQPGPVPPEES
jgi:putative peptidoglycan lipid II flippase